MKYCQNITENKSKRKSSQQSAGTIISHHHKLPTLLSAYGSLVTLRSAHVTGFAHASSVMSVCQVINRNRLQPTKIHVKCLVTTLPGGANLPGAGPGSCARPLCLPPLPPAINSCGINSPAPSPARVASRPGSPVGRFGFV